VSLTTVLAAIHGETAIAGRRMLGGSSARARKPEDQRIVALQVAQRSGKARVVGSA
jgi:hypothetical protein